MIFRKVRLTVALLLIGFTIGEALSCASLDRPTPILSGRLVGFVGNEISCFDLSTGLRDSLIPQKPLSNPRILCEVPSRKLLIKCDGPHKQPNTLRRQWESDSIFVYEPERNSLDRWLLPGMPSRIVCKAMAYDSIRNQYLLFGGYDDLGDSLGGVFLLDSAFSVAKTLTGDFGFEVGHSSYGPVYFTEVGCVFGDGNVVKFYDFDTQTVSLTIEGRLKAISPDRRFVVIEMMSDRGKYLVSLSSGDRKLIVTGKTLSLDWAFSPDGKYLAYSVAEGFPETHYMYFMDIKTGATWKTDFRVSYGFVWVK